MKRLAIALLGIVATTGCLFAGDIKRPVVRGTDDLSRYIATREAPSGQTTMRDASGRTVGSVNAVGTRTMFRDSAGRTTGSAPCRGKPDGVSGRVAPHGLDRHDLKLCDHHLS